MARRFYTVYIIIAVLSCCLSVMAQDNAYLRELTTCVKKLRTGNDNTCKAIARQIGDKSKPKITLLDNLGQSANEVVGKNVYAFKLNKVVAWAHKNQNNRLVTKGTYFSSNESGVAYSAIEKIIKGGSKARYNLKGHFGIQEMVVVAYHLNTQFSLVLKVNEKVIKSLTVKDMACVKTPSLREHDTITIELSVPSNVAGGQEAFATINYNGGLVR